MPENILASLEAKIDAPAETEPEEETEAEEEEAPDAAQELAEHATKEAIADKPEKSPSDDPDPEEIKKAGLRQADYTRKTQALAEERKALHAQISKEREEYAQREEAYQEVREWLENIKDPDVMEFELSRYYPETVSALRDKWILESQEEAQLTERERAAIRRAKDAEIKLRAREQDQERNKKVQAKRQSAQQSAQLRTQFQGWLSEVVGPAGLDDDEETLQMIRERLIAGYGNESWTKETFAKAAADVARRLKREPKPKDDPKLPPAAKGSGHKAPPGTPTKKQQPKKHSEEYFRELRAKYGVS